MKESDPRPSPLTWIACACVILCAPALAQSKIKLDKEQKIKDWGYSIKTIVDWSSIPADQDNKFCVGRWKLNLDDLRLRGDYDGVRSGSRCDLQIIRIPLQSVTTGAKPAEEEPKEPKEGETRIILSESMKKRLMPKTVIDWIEGTYDGAPKRWVRTPLKGGKMPGELFEFGSGADAITIGYFQRPGAEWAVVYSSFEESYRKTWQDIYLKSIQTFVVTTDLDPDVAAAARSDPNKLEGDAKRQALIASIAGNPGWYAVDTKYYVILSNSKNKAFINSLSKDLETVREKVYSKYFPPRNKSTPLSPVRVLDTESEYYQYGGPGGSAGYFSPDSGELVLFTKFEDVSKTSSLEYCRSVAFHEAFHQYIHFAVGDVSPHSWFNEGHGDYFAGMVVSSGNIKFDTFSWRVDFLKEKMREGNDLIPLRSLIRYPQSEYYTNAGLKYSQGWAVIYYLRNVTRNKRHKEILDRYFTYLADNVEAFRAKKKEKGGDEGKPEPVPGIPGIKIIDWEDREKVEKILSEAVDKAFEGVDLEALDKELRAWVEKL
jgi:hypothetical protein